MSTEIHVPLSPSTDCIVPLPDPAVDPICAAVGDVPVIGVSVTPDQLAGRELLDAAASAPHGSPGELADLMNSAAITSPWLPAVAIGGAALVLVVYLVSVGWIIVRDRRRSTP